MNHPFFSYGIGIATQNKKREIIEVYYPKPILQPEVALIDAIAKIHPYQGGSATFLLEKNQLKKIAALLPHEIATFLPWLIESHKPIVLSLLEEDTPPAHTAEAYLKLHLLSHRLVKPHQTNLQGIFKVLPNLAWTNQGAIDLEELAEQQCKMRCLGQALSVDSIDKFPKMSDYVIPCGVRIADCARVRLGAYLGPGTTIMHEGFVNFNAGTEGASMVEGRISAGVLVGENSDLGGGCSTMGTLSGGNKVVISIGAGCLLGANSGVGIPLGNNCTVEAGLYITAGTKVNLIDNKTRAIKIMKARELAGSSNLLFRRNSQTGAVECLKRNDIFELNTELHQHN